MRKIIVLLLPFLLLSFAAAQRKPAPPPVRTDATRLSTVAMIDLPGRPGFSASAFAGNYIVVSQTTGNAIDIFDPQKRRLAAQVTNIAQPRGIAVDPKNNRFFVATANSVIAVISSQDWEVKDTFHVDGSPDVLALSADGVRLYVGDKENSTVTAVDTSLRKSIGSVQLEGRPEAIAVADDNSIFVAVQDTSSIVKIDPQLQVAAQFKLQASQPAGMAYDAASRRLFVAVRSAILAINADNGSEAARAPAPNGVENLAFDPASHMLFAAGGGSILSFNTVGGLNSRDELLADVKGHSVVYDAGRKLLFMPGGREGRSKMLIVKDLTGAQPAPADSEAKLQ